MTGQHAEILVAAIRIIMIGGVDDPHGACDLNANRGAQEFNGGVRFIQIQPIFCLDNGEGCILRSQKLFLSHLNQERY